VPEERGRSTGRHSHPVLCDNNQPYHVTIFIINHDRQQQQQQQQKCPATQQQRLTILGTTDPPLDILSSDPLQVILYLQETVLL